MVFPLVTSPVPGAQVPIRFTPLRSGSSGNCTLLSAAGIHVLIDAGLSSQKAILEVLDIEGIAPQQISALLVTHLHRDHFNLSTLGVCRTYAIPVYLHEKNAGAVRSLHPERAFEGVELCTFPRNPFHLGALEISHFGLSHDAPGTTSGFRFSLEGSTLTYAADLGHFPESLAVSFLDSDTIFLEANHDPDLLWKNPLRPYQHKKRVSGKRGHLSNEQAAQALALICQASGRHPKTIILGHLSGDHNTQALAIETVHQALQILGIDSAVYAAHRDRPLYTDQHSDRGF